MASIHQKSKNGVWYISYLQGGKLKHRSLGTRNIYEAKRLKKEIELKAEVKPDVEYVVIERPKGEMKNPAVETFWNKFLEWAQRARSRSAIEEYTTWFNRFVAYTGIDYIGDANSEHAKGFLAHLLEMGKRKPQGIGLEKTSVNNALKTLRSIWNHAIRLGLYTGDNPFRSVEPYKIPQRAQRDYLEREAIAALLQATERYAQENNVRRLEARNIRLAIALMALAGLRKREACFARWEWIRWDSKLLVVSSHEAFTTKNKRNRIISMHEDLVRTLEPFRQNEGYILEATRASNGKNRYRVEFKKSFHRVCDLAGVTATPHALRHSFASRHAVAGTSLHVIAGWLGHSTTSVTERYAHFQTGYNEAANNI